MALVSKSIEEKIVNNFKKILEPKLIEEVIEHGRLHHAREGNIMIDYGQYMKELPLVLSGTIKILRKDNDGNELFLYYLNGGDSCAMSMTCCVGDKKSEIRAVAEDDSEIWMLPIRYMDEWMTYKTWQAFVFNSYNARFEELLNTIDSIAFLRMDERLWKYLLDKKQASASYIITKTHQDIASELNTSRVVISRLLKQLERDEKIELYRNRIEVL